MRIFSRFPYTGLLSDAWDRHSQFRMVRIMRSWKYPEKYHTLCFIPNGRKKILLAEMNQALSLHKKGTGIAVSIPMNGMPGISI